ncbi:unnamed protein product [Linum tenue]|uniref:Uncharacterized protein n=1 Tax=Linum tenue TaxID=586396 RepID=A0AAV0NZ93_9ROSI|nr:unnamed protein product [Linum tenue]
MAMAAFSSLTRRRAQPPPRVPSSPSTRLDPLSRARLGLPCRPPTYLRIAVLIWLNEIKERLRKRRKRDLAQKLWK